MTSFNEVDGIPASGNRWLMTEVLRNQWGFDGFVVTDYTAINEMEAHGMGDLQTVSALALKAGVDFDMIGEGFLTTLEKSLDEGKVTKAEIDLACRRMLEAKYSWDCSMILIVIVTAQPSLRQDISTRKISAAAREIAAQTFVLLKNENQLLPLQKKGRIALIGPLAENRDNMAGMWAVATDHEQSVTVLEGFKAAVGNEAEIIYARGSNIVDDPELDSHFSWVKVELIPCAHPSSFGRKLSKQQQNLMLSWL